MAGRLARAHLARDLDGAAVPQQLFGKRGLARVGVRDDGECAPAADFFFERGHGGTAKKLSPPFYPSNRPGLGEDVCA